MKPFVIFFRQFIRSGRVVVFDADGQRHVFGQTSAAHNPSDTVTIRLHDRRLHWQLVTRPSLALGEAFMDGTLTLENGTTLYRLLTVLMRNMSEADAHGVIGFVAGIRRMLGRWSAFNPIARSRRNVAHHYDLGDDLFNLFLDSDRQYSCAYFADPSNTLEEAQANKKELIARKLVLRPGQHVLDIGSGWGGLGLSLAKGNNVDVTGLTLSERQLAISNERARAEGLDDRCRFIFRDYRQEHTTYDRIVSVGMFEHVGLRNYGTFFRQAAALLKDDGVMLLHSVGMFNRPGPIANWMEKYIFPGAYVPTLAEVTPYIEAAGLMVTDIEIWRLHYAETLRHWRMRFLANREAALALYDERFCRMWEFYLTCCEVSFRIGDLMVFQIQLAKRQESVPLTRDYLWTKRPGGATVTDISRVRGG